MFDVSWADPGVETLGQRKARKAKEQEAKEAKDLKEGKEPMSGSDSQGGSKRHSALTTSSKRSSSSGDKGSSSLSLSRNDGDSVKSPTLFGFSLRRKRLSAKSKTNLALDLQIPIPEGSIVPPSIPTASTFGSTFSSKDFALDDERFANVPAVKGGKYQLELTSSSGNNSRLASMSGSMISNSTVVTPPFPLSPMGKLNFEASSPSRPGTEHPRNKAETLPVFDPEVSLMNETFLVEGTPAPYYHRAVTEISAAAATDDKASQFQPASPPWSPLNPPTSRIQSPLTSPSRIQMELDANAAETADGAATRVNQLPFTTPPPRQNRNFVSQIPVPMYRFTAHDPDHWKSVEEWDNEERLYDSDGDEISKKPEPEPEPVVTGRRDSDTVKINLDDSVPVQDLESVQKELTRMVLYAPKTITYRLHWQQDPFTDIMDAEGYKNFEMVKKRLLWFALRGWSEPGMKMRFMDAIPKPLPMGTKVLALFEGEATASYISAVHIDSEITHMSPKPLSNVHFPNVTPLHSPIMSKALQSLAPSNFDAVYCHNLPTLLPSQEIPGFLRAIYHILKFDGILHLILFDPTPVAASMGPHTRQWMEDHLVLNMERKFRCTKPRKLFPDWLKDEYLRADKTAVKTYRCPVVFKEIDELAEANDLSLSTGSKEDGESLKTKNPYVQLLRSPGKAEKDEQDERDRLELQVTVARMMWKEMWGSFVVADRWWWEVPAILDECLRLGTYWEYSIVEAKKDI